MTRIGVLLLRLHLIGGRKRRLETFDELDHHRPTQLPRRFHTRCRSRCRWLTPSHRVGCWYNLHFPSHAGAVGIARQLTQYRWSGECGFLFMSSFRKTLANLTGSASPDRAGRAEGDFDLPCVKLPLGCGVE